MLSTDQLKHLTRRLPAAQRAAMRCLSADAAMDELHTDFLDAVVDEAYRLIDPLTEQGWPAPAALARHAELAMYCGL